MKNSDEVFNTVKFLEKLAAIPAILDKNKVKVTPIALKFKLNDIFAKFVSGFISATDISQYCTYDT
jgi:hypothetical protein